MYVALLLYVCGTVAVCMWHCCCMYVALLVYVCGTVAVCMWHCWCMYVALFGNRLNLKLFSRLFNCALVGEKNFDNNCVFLP